MAETDGGRHVLVVEGYAALMCASGGAFILSAHPAETEWGALGAACEGRLSTGEGAMAPVSQIHNGQSAFALSR